MGAVPFNRVAAAIFAIFGALHAYRLFAPFPVVIGSIEVPQAASLVVVLVAGLLSLWGFRSRA